MPNTVDLASLLCSRLCHDMLSPVGALSNGIELLREERDPEMRQRCMELLEQSAKISADKLKFFRLAYGAAGGFGDSVPSEEPHDLVRDLVGDNGRIVLQWAVGEPQLSKPAVKVLLNLAAIGIGVPGPVDFSHGMAVNPPIMAGWHQAGPLLEQPGFDRRRAGLICGTAARRCAARSGSAAATPTISKCSKGSIPASASSPRPIPASPSATG